MSETPHTPPDDDLEAVAEWVEKLDPAYVRCRVRHAWNELSSSVSEIGDELRQTVDCSSCGATQTLAVDATTGVILRNSTSYPAGYERRGLGRLSSAGRGIVRLKKLRRSLEG